MTVLNNFIRIMLFWELLNIFLAPVVSQFSPGCDSVSNIKFGENHFVNSPNYPSQYPPNTLCRWRFQSPPNTVIRIICSDFSIPATPNCQVNRLSISLTGHPTLNDAVNFCGTKVIDATSHANALSVGLKSADPGRFSCLVNAIPGGGGGGIQDPTTTTTRPNTCDCGWKQQRKIVGGTETAEHEFAFMAALANRVGQIYLWCGSTIISDRYAITAAHCVYEREADDFLILVGLHRFSDRRYENAVMLERFIIHSYYNDRTQENDIALVRTAQTIPFGLTVGPICLPYRYTDLDFANAPVTVMGWGLTSFSGQLSDPLLAANVTVFARDSCQAYFPDDPINGGTLCTYGYQKDACTFDSGGPVVWFDDWNTNRYQLLGIVSYGKDCGVDSPAVNTRVPTYVSWILNQTPEVEYCLK